MKKVLKKRIIRNSSLKFLLLSITIVLFSCSESNKDQLSYSGTIENRDILISSQSKGEIQELYFDEGDLVNAGDTLAVINHQKLDLQLLEALAGQKALQLKLRMLENGARKEDRKLAEERLKQAEANYKLATKNKDRMEKLNKTESITRKQFDEALLAYKISRSNYYVAKENLAKTKSSRPEQIEQLEATIEQGNAKIELLNKYINDCYITAPISGQIVNRFVEKGEVVTFLSSIFKLTDLTDCKLTIYVSEIDLAKINLGDSVEIKIDAFEKKSFPGKIIFISPEAEFTPKNIQTKDERTKLVFAVKIEIKNNNKILKSGMPADAIIKL